MNISISDKAKTHIINTRPAIGARLRVGLRPAGCAGFEYVLEFDEQLRDGEVELDCGEVKLAVASKDQAQLNGVELDWIDERLGSRMVIKNPNEKRSCGCGMSVGF